MSVIVTASDTFAATAAAHLAELIQAAITVRGGCSIALCGGNTPRDVYRQLVGGPIDWSRVTIYFGDERAVPPDHSDSNFGMAQRTLLNAVPVSTDRIHRMKAERADIDVAAREYDNLLPPRLGLLLLGMGSDGHTASLFPGSPAVAEARRRVVAVASPPPSAVPQLPRITITPLAIAAARQVVVMVQGASKAAMLKQVLEGADQPAIQPAQFARAGTWIVDPAVASALQSRDS